MTTHQGEANMTMQADTSARVRAGTRARYQIE